MPSQAAEFSGYVSAVVGFPDRATAPHGIVLTWYKLKNKRDRNQPGFESARRSYDFSVFRRPIPGKCAGNGGLCQRVYCAHFT